VAAGERGIDERRAEEDAAADEKEIHAMCGRV
jgi:hypothetical protein